MFAVFYQLVFFTLPKTGAKNL